MRAPYFINQYKSLRVESLGRWIGVLALLSLLGLGCNQPAVLMYPSEVPFSDCGEDPRQLFSSCPSERCIGVYVTPWCTYCTQMMPVIHALPEQAWRRGMATCAVIGNDSPARLREYATRHGLSATFDPESVIPIHAVPTVFMFDKQGRILKQIKGMAQHDDSTLYSAEYYIENLILD